MLAVVFHKLKPTPSPYPNWYHNNKSLISVW